MVDGINGARNNKEWSGINDTTQNKEYLEALDKKILSILDGKQTISVEELRQKSVFKNMPELSEKRFNNIASLDGDGKTFSVDELKVLYSLADAKLVDGKFKFDANLSVDADSGLEQAYDNEVEAVMTNLLSNEFRKRIETIDVSKYDRALPFAEKIQSNDVDEVMLALQDKLSVGVNKSTGKSLSVVQAVLLLKRCIDEVNNYEEGCQKFINMTGVNVSDFSRLRTIGDGDSFTLGDWRYDRGNMTNTKTGEKLEMDSVLWVNSSVDTVPAAKGDFAYINNYDDGNGVSLQFEYGNDENVAPTSVNIVVNGVEKRVVYDPKSKVDPELYNFLER